MSKNKTVWINRCVHKKIDMLWNGSAVKVTIKGKRHHIIGVMYVYDKLPKGEKTENFMEAEVCLKQ